MSTFTQTPGWLRKLERAFGWIAIPNIAILLVTLQGLGFLMVLSDPVWLDRLALDPSLVRAGEFWRVITWLALPFSMSPLWIFFALYFLYFIVNAIEHEWGEFKTTLYVLVSIVVTVAYSLLTGFPILQATDFETSLFLASAALFPEMDIQLFFAIPVKLKWMGLLSGAFVLLRFFQYDLWGKLYLAAIYSAFLLFFGPAVLSSVRNRIRRERFRRKMNAK